MLDRYKEEDKSGQRQEPGRGMHDGVTKSIIRVFYDVYNELGYGFLESVYRESMRIALDGAGLRVKTEVAVPVSFRGNLVGVFRADLIVEGAVLVELKACEVLVKEHLVQTLHYLRATEIEVALLMNFGVEAKFRRLAMSNGKKKLRLIERRPNADLPAI